MEWKIRILLLAVPLWQCVSILPTTYDYKSQFSIQGLWSAWRVSEGRHCRKRSFFLLLSNQAAIPVCWLFDISLQYLLQLSNNRSTSSLNSCPDAHEKTLYQKGVRNTKSCPDFVLKRKPRVHSYMLHCENFLILL